MFPPVAPSLASSVQPLTQSGPTQFVILATMVLLAAFGLVVVAIGVGFAVRSARVRSFGKRLASTEPDSIAGLTGGEEVVLEGIAEPYGEPMTAPLSGRGCLAYNYSTEVYRPDDNGRKKWANEASGGGNDPFLLDTGHGTVQVEPTSGGGNLVKNTNIEIDGDEEIVRFDAGEERPDRIEQFVAETDAIEDNTKQRKHFEWILKPGEEATVSGVLRQPKYVDAEVSREATFVLADEDRSGLLAKLRPPKLKISDRPFRETGTDLVERGRNGVITGILLIGVGVFVLYSTVPKFT